MPMVPSCREAVDPAAYAVGFVVSTGMIHVFGIAVGLVAGRLYGGMVSRALGGLIAARRHLLSPSAVV